jgi:hypothetical protein
MNDTWISRNDMKKKTYSRDFFEPVINHYVQLAPTLQAAASIDKAWFIDVWVKIAF